MVKIIQVFSTEIDPLKMHIIFIFIILFITIIIITSNRHVLGHDRPVWASSKSLFQGIPSYDL